MMRAIFYFVERLALPLLVTAIRAQDTNHALAADDLAVLAKLLN